MPRVSATKLLKPIAALRATAIVRFVRRAFVKGAAAGGALAVLAAITLALLAAATPSGDFLFLPSPAQPVGPVVKVAGEAADGPPSGPGFLFTAVTQRRASRLESWIPFLRDDHAELVPGHALIPPGGTPEEQDKVDRAAMTDSQRTARRGRGARAGPRREDHHARRPGRRHRRARRVARARRRPHVGRRHHRHRRHAGEDAGRAARPPREVEAGRHRDRLLHARRQAGDRQGHPARVAGRARPRRSSASAAATTWTSPWRCR